ncbi:MAG: tRNA (adenosine(37)-N6)-threonylcarbamoyltransferase complex ATPase subunit type 1 TsaE [Chloroflexota bacterium]|nr:tRNA (adenosine(37)-N6)-threonylcarbamoyltransferase complex ATPase subunit type 1 TsaE [Chloroflexota bacterium]
MRLGALLAPLLLPGDVLPLWGGFGVGKTTFVQGVGRGLGVERPVVSPSFGLVNVYPNPHVPLYHLDLYRVSSAAEAEVFGVDEILGGDGAALIEWPSVLLPKLPSERLDVYFELAVGDEERTIRFEAGGRRAVALLDALQASVG